MEKPVVLGASWRYLADKGDAVGAMNAAEQAGFAWLANSMPRGDVLVLGDVARKAKQPGRAMEAQLAVRARFGGTVGASEAALRLGHLAEEQRDVEAVRWYSEAAREAPNAATAPKALGDWLGVLVRAERTAEAKKIAGEYLKRFKNGPRAGGAGGAGEVVTGSSEAKHVEARDALPHGDVHGATRVHSLALLDFVWVKQGLA